MLELALVVASLFLSSSVEAADHKTGKMEIAAPTAPTRLSVMPGEVHRLYRGVDLYIPRDIEAAEQVPLLILLPGTKGSGLNMVETLRGVADLHGFALLGFSSTKDNFSAVDHFFDDRERGKPTAYDDWPAPRFGKDLDRLEASIERVLSIAPIDRDRIGLVGFSHGGSWALMVGTANPDLFSTIAALSPGLLVIPRSQVGTQSILLSHGTKDQVQPYRRTACAMVPRLREFGNRVEFHSFDGGHDLPAEITAEALEHFLAGRHGRTLPTPLPAPDC